MGTRADFYIGLDKSAEWLGSIAWDGDDIPEAVWSATDEQTFRREVEAFLATRDDATVPAQGWPWPWNDSGLTDCVYQFGNGVVHGELSGWLLPRAEYESEGNVEPHKRPGAIRVDFPDMSARKNFTLGKRSGVIVVGG